MGLLEDFLDGQQHSFLVAHGGLLYPADHMGTRWRQMFKGIYPGSFNPVHQDHINVHKAAEMQLGGKVAYEISVVNADKGNLTADEVLDRLNQTPLINDDVYVFITKASLFREKMSLFPHTTVIMGADTFERFLDPKYLRKSFDFFGQPIVYNAQADEYLLQRQLEDMTTLGCSVIVAERNGKTLDSVIESSAVPWYNHRRQFHKLINYQPIGLSSTAIRAGEQQPFSY